MGAPPPPQQLGFTDKSTYHSPSEPNGSDAVSVPIIKPPMTMGGAAAILPLPPTKDTRVRQSRRGVAFLTKPRALSEPSARRPQVSITPAGAQQGYYPSWVCREHLEWIEQEVARRVAAALALSKDENAPITARSAGAPYKDAGTQVDPVIPTARASEGAGDDCVLIEKKVPASFQKLSLSRFLTLSLSLSNKPNGGIRKKMFLFFSQANMLTFLSFFAKKKEDKKSDG